VANVGVGGAGGVSCSTCRALGICNPCSSRRMWLRVFCCTLACSLALESPDLSLETWSFGLESIGVFSRSLDFHLEEEGVLGAVYRGEEERSESLCLILCFTIVVDAQNSWSLEGESILL